MSTSEWWRDAVVYQIYPRSYVDSDGDGVGDLKGIEAKLDYITDLGVDAIWLSPVYPSPNRDFGYDVSDYCAIHPQFGSLADFDRLLAGAHARGLKVILDQVLSHSSDAHPWFLESLKGAGGEKADWYVWADAREDGTPPNNWLAAFGGAAWSWHPLRRQYYFHKFLKQQPKLNFHNPDVVAALMDVLRFWLDRGVDGFRLDVANSFVHDPALTDNPPVPMAERTGFNWAHAPFLQRHVRDANTTENSWAMRQVRRVMDEYADRLAFGEFSEEPEMLPHYAGGMDLLHTGYTFHFLNDWTFEPKVFREYYETMLGPAQDLWPCVTFSNHDVVRPVTRWGGGEGNNQLAKLHNLLLLTLKGTPLMYQGEELGLPEARIPRTQLKDPLADLYPPVSPGRDGCRTPMPWVAGAPHGGFSPVEPWLPVPASHAERAVDVQQSNSGSVFAFTRGWLRLRRGHVALKSGEIEFVDAPGSLLVYWRRHSAETWLIVANLGSASAAWRLPDEAANGEQMGEPVGSVTLTGQQVLLEGHSAFALKI